jgi:phenylpyruvate tautomerase PptA (4-oxalocrotonate tautomerase family)
MPDVLVEVREGWLAGQQSRFPDAIHAAIVEALQTPKDDKVVRLTEHQPEQFAIPSSAGENYTHIELTMFVGRSVATKRALYQAIVRNIEPFGVPPNDVKIILTEVPPENVGMRGGKAACDLDLGYELNM